MRRLRPTDGTPLHKRAAQYHLAKLTTGGAPIHQELHAEMAAKYADLKAKARAVEDAEDDASAASALADHAEIKLENTIRDIDADLGKLDRQVPTLSAQIIVFPHGYGAEIDPEGAAQLAGLPALRARIAQFSAHGIVIEALARFDAAHEAFAKAIEAEEKAEALVDTLFAEELEARRAIREQFESAYGRLRDHYKARPALVEEFFLKEGRRRTPKKGPTDG
ncbi:hypothetical protein [Polyangium sp. y55x31]|uniref:hypothetical protein n=1 Tax=Polyangium sp. y55x31 TaxID=3042688 RepID=UPI00248230D8|nr:hypothetical protein [Polyangium sp. y55x31]MDI1483467.1 hypothetical protein [Polyangium sp. y55x31]